MSEDVAFFMNRNAHGLKSFFGRLSATMSFDIISIHGKIITQDSGAVMLRSSAWTKHKTPTPLSLR